MKLLQLSNSERKKKMKMNILRHRQKLLKYLQNDLTLKTKIINVDRNNVVDSNIFNEVKIELPLKVEVIQELIPEEKLKCGSTDNNASIGSNSEWLSICQNENETLLDTKRRSSRLELVKNDVHHQHNTRNEDCKYIYVLRHNIIVSLTVIFFFKLCTTLIKLPVREINKEKRKISSLGNLV